MTEKQLKSGLRLSHRWVGAVAAVLLLVAGITGFLLQHPEWLGPPANPKLALAADPSAPERLLRGTHWGVEQSVDGGRTWAELPMLAPPTDVVSIAFAPDDPRVVWALGRDALVVSRDGGRVWWEVSVDAATAQESLSYRDLAVGPGTALAVLTDGGLLTSGDEGRSWQWIGREDSSPSGNWLKFVHDLHTGHLFGGAGRRVVEFGALAMVFLTLTGIVLIRRNGKVFRR